MKILYHHRTRSRDGQNVHIEELVGALRRLGHEVIVVGPGGDVTRPQPAAPDKKKAGGPSLRDLMPKALYEILELGYAIPAYWRLARAARKHRPDVLYERYNLHQPAGVAVARRFGLPMLLEVNAPLVEERGAHGGLALPGLARWSEGFTWRGADVCLPVTRVLADRVAAYGVPEERLMVVPNGINRERFGAAPPPAEAKARLGLSGRVVLGFTGWVRDWHRLDQVIGLLPGQDDLHLLLVGDGPARSALEEQARALGVADRVTVTGPVARDAVAAHVAAFDVALQPAVTPYASPLKLFEYLYLGRPVVAPDTPNIREVLTHGRDAVLFDPDDADAFRRAVATLCDDAPARDRIGAAGRALIEARGYTWESNARRVTVLAESLVRRRSARLSAEQGHAADTSSL